MKISFIFNHIFGRTPTPSSDSEFPKLNPWSREFPEYIVFGSEGMSIASDYKKTYSSKTTITTTTTTATTTSTTPETASKEGKGSQNKLNSILFLIQMITVILFFNVTKM